MTEDMVIFVVEVGLSLIGLDNPGFNHLRKELSPQRIK
jgi:hypothetical protein